MMGASTMSKHVLWFVFSIALVASCAGKNEVVRGSGALHDACASGDLDRCHTQGLLLETGDADDRRNALTAFQFGCLLKHAASCTSLARMYGDDGASNAAVMAQLTEACDAGESEACVRLGDRAPHAQAVAYYEKACEADHGNGCHRLADAMRKGWVIEENVTRALELDERACELESVDGCIAAGQAYLFGSGVAKDPAKGMKYLETTCTKSIRGGCKVLGVLYEKGIGVTPDTAKAAAYYELAGPTSDVVANSPRKAYIVFVDACNRGNYLGCFDAAWFLEEGVDVERNITTAREMYNKSCQGGITMACERAKPARTGEKG